MIPGPWLRVECGKGKACFFNERRGPPCTIQDVIGVFRMPRTCETMVLKSEN
jgi:hypothetical protein